MPKNGSVGESKATFVKQKHLDIILSTHTKIGKSLINKHKWLSKKYLYIDLYAGSGTTMNNMGSPLIFFKNAMQEKLEVDAYLVEEDKNTCNLLIEEVDNYVLNQEYDFTSIMSGKCFPGNNKDFMNEFLKIKRSGKAEKMTGLIYLDPNNYPDFNLLTDISNINNFSMVDYLINCPANTQKRCPKKWPINLIESINKINKDYWIIRDPIDIWQWTFIIGTNWDAFPQFKKHGFHKISSQEGRNILFKLNYTKEQLRKFELYGYYPKSYKKYRSHPYYQILEREAISNAKGYIYQNGKKTRTSICQICKTKEANQVHHLKYPEWGQFDEIENLLPVCQYCHAREHKKVI